MGCGGAVWKRKHPGYRTKLRGSCFDFNTGKDRILKETPTNSQCNHSLTTLLRNATLNGKLHNEN